MGHLGISILLFAAGVILVWATDTTMSGIELATVGWILIAVGGIGAVLSLAFWSTWDFPRPPAEREDERRRHVEMRR